MVNNNIFEYATRNKLRFQSARGAITAEDLWDVPLRSRPGDDFNLNEIAKAANGALKEASEESFVEQARTPAHTRLEVTLEVVKHVIAAKLDDEETAKRRADNKAKKDKLLAVLERKQDEKFEKLDIRDLQRQIAALDE
jgi:hypothetical protein